MVAATGLEHWNRLGIYPGTFEGILYYCVLVTSSGTNDMLAAGSGWVVELETGQVPPLHFCL